MTPNDPQQPITDLLSLGMLLKSTREGRAVSLEEAEVQTRIRLKYLQALESGDFSTMPSMTHAKGFLRNYARFLSLDVNTIINDFGRLTGERVSSVTTITAPPASPPPAPQKPAEVRQTGSPQPSPYEESAPPPPPPSPYPTTRQSTYITPSQRSGPAQPLGLGQKASTPITGQFARPSFTPPPAQKTEEAPNTTQPIRFWQSIWFTLVILVIGFVAVVSWATTSLSQISVGDLIPTEQGSTVLEDFAADNIVTPSPTFAPTSTPAPETGPQIFGRVVLSISVEQRTWVQITIDGEIVLEGQVTAGTSLQYEGAEEIRILAGNGAGLIVIYNGQEIGPLGSRGEVVERIFTVGGQITPTPTPTVTPTSTSVPTSTPRATATDTP